MNWVQENKFLSAWIAVVALISAILGFLLFKAFGAYKTANASYTQTANAVAGLEKQVPYPNEENVKNKNALVGDYSNAVTDLQKKLVTYQRPLRRLTEIEFQNKLKRSVEAIKALAEQKEATLPESFSLGMARYITGLPQPQACPLLDFQLESLDFLANVIVESGASSIDVFERAPLPIEAGKVANKEGEEKPVLRRFPIEIGFTAPDQSALEGVINSISNAPSENFYHIIRLVRIENEERMGPPKTVQSAPVATESFSDFSGLEGLGGEVEVAPDAHYVLGEEKLKVFLRIELLHFLEPKADEPAAENAEKPVAVSN